MDWRKPSASDVYVDRDIIPSLCFIIMEVGEVSDGEFSFQSLKQFVELSTTKVLKYREQKAKIIPCSNDIYSLFSLIFFLFPHLISMKVKPDHGNAWTALSRVLQMSLTSRKSRII